MSIQQERFKQIADAIREKTNDTDLIKPNELANKIADVYDAGYNAGYNEGCNTSDSNEYDLGYINGRNTMISRSLKSIDDESLTTIGNYAFAGMGITSVNLPNVYRVGKYAFRGCTGLTEIDLPSLTHIGGKGHYAFGFCEKVIHYNLPNLRTDNTQDVYTELIRTFEGNFAIERLELKNEIVIGTHCFYRCESLKTLILGSSASLKDTNAFDATPIKNGTGYIYVPDDCVSTYKSATNWVGFASQIKGYSEMPISFYVDGVEYLAPVSTWKDLYLTYNDGTFNWKYTENGDACMTVNDLFLHNEDSTLVSYWAEIIPNQHYYTTSS